MHIYKSVGKKVRELRLNLGLTQEKLAERVHSTTSYIARIEQGKRKPTLEFLSKVAMALNVSLSDIFSQKNISLNSILLREICQILEKQPEPILRIGINLIKVLAEGYADWYMVSGEVKVADKRISYNTRSSARGPYKKKSKYI